MIDTTTKIKNWSMLWRSKDKVGLLNEHHHMPRQTQFWQRIEVELYVQGLGQSHFSSWRRVVC